MTSIESEEIISKIESNFRNLWVTLPDLLGGELQRDGKVITYYTGVPFPPFNGVVSSGLNSTDLAVTIRQTQDYFKSKNSQILWWVFPSDQSTNLETELENHGFVKAGADPGMAVRLEDVTAEMPQVPGLEIIKAQDFETITTWSEVMVEVYGAPAFLTELFVKIGLRFNELNVGQYYNYLALLNGRPVGTSSVFITPDGVSGIYSVTTLESARRKGIGRALTLTALLEARQVGSWLGILGSSEIGYRVYQDLGFKEYCKINQYFWQPEVLELPGF